MITAPTTIRTSPISFTAPEKKRLSEAASELQRVDQLLEDVAHLKVVLDTAAADFANGKISIVQAAALLSAAGDSSARAELEGKLRRPLKAKLRSIVDDVTDLIEKSRKHHIAELAAKASSVEKIERAQSAELGIPDDDFTPSVLLEGVREQHKRALDASAVPPTRTELRQLLVGIE